MSSSAGLPAVFLYMRKFAGILKLTCTLSNILSHTGEFPMPSCELKRLLERLTRAIEKRCWLSIHAIADAIALLTRTPEQT